MLPLTVNLLPDTSSGVARTPATVPALPTTSLAPISQAARPQLASAIIASTPLAAFAAETPQPPKPPLRLITSQASSALAAQYIAQIPGVSEDDLAIFATRARSSNGEAVEEGAEQASEGDDFLTSLRIARSEQVAPPLKQVANEASAGKPAPAETPPVPLTIATATNAIRAGTSAVTGLPQTLSLQFSSKLPPAQLGSVKKPGLSQARGASAYQVAEARNTNAAPTVKTLL